MSLRNWTIGALKGLMIFGLVTGAGLALTGCCEKQGCASQCEQKKACCAKDGKCCAKDGKCCTDGKCCHKDAK